MTRPIEEWLAQPGGIAERLREARRRAGLTGAQVAEANGWPASKISKLENGRQTPTVSDIHAWMTTVGAVGEVDELVAMLNDIQTRYHGWRRRMRAGQAAVQAGYNEIIRRASVVRDYTMTWAPSMLQTAQYARYPLLDGVTLHGAAEDEVDQAVATRMQRQAHLYDPAKRFEFLLDEPVLSRLVCPPDVLRGQLDRLQAVIGMPNVRLGVLPSRGRRLPIGPANSFTIVDDDLILIETTGGEVRPDEELFDTHVKAMDLLWSVAVEGEDARRLIVEAAQLLPTM